MASHNPSVSQPFTPTKKLTIQCAGTCNGETSHSFLTQVTASYNEKYFHATDHFAIVQCGGCHTLSFVILSTNSEEVSFNPETEELECDVTETLYPSRIAGRAALKNTASIPSGVLQIYEETHSAIAANLRIVAGIGIRAIVEAVCKEKKAAGKVLANQIDGLVTLGIITKDSADILHNIRVMGNEAAHEAKANTEEELSIAFDVIESVLLTVYIIPEKASKLRKRNP